MDGCMKIRSIHPFPARMAPDLALDSLGKLAPGSIVLDPMAGSGTVLRQALALGHEAVGFDLDPLAVLMSRVWTTPVDDAAIEVELASVLEEADMIDLRGLKLPWQQDIETTRFIDYWFFTPQRRELTRLAAVLQRRRQLRLGPKRAAAIDVLRVAFSRIIVTKEQGASLARDTSHSRPHRVAEKSIYEVRPNFERSVNQLRLRLLDSPTRGTATVEHGDARSLTVDDASVDVVMTSPPYLNAIDYMRGHRMSLVWLGHSIPELRRIRSTTIGAERAITGHDRHKDVERVMTAMCDIRKLAPRVQGMVARYAGDLLKMTAEVARVLRPGGVATYVVGNSCLKGVFVRNADGVAKAAELAGMHVKELRERDLPESSRYLPMTDAGSLSKRMRTETVLTYENQLH